MLLLVKIFAIILGWTLVQGSQRDKLFFIENSGDQNKTLLVVTWTETDQEIEAGCEFFTDKELINEVLESSKGFAIQTLSGDEMQNIQEDCIEISLIRRKRELRDEETEEETYEEDSSNIALDDVLDEPVEARRGSGRRRGPNRRRNPSRQGNTRQSKKIATTTFMDENEIETTTDFYENSTMSNEVSTTTEGPSGWPIIFPGTRWCGSGDRAQNYDDLGVHKDTDICCRAHDNCDDYLASGETKYNLTNTSPFTKLNCKCDREFYDCLDQANTAISNTIGNMYFNVLRRECYEFDHPFTSKCNKYRTVFKLVCQEYERNTTEPKVYQWVPAKRYSKIPVPGPLTVTLPF